MHEIKQAFKDLIVRFFHRGIIVLFIIGIIEKWILLFWSLDYPRLISNNLLYLIIWKDFFVLILLGRVTFEKIKTNIGIGN